MDNRGLPVTLLVPFAAHDARPAVGGPVVAQPFVGFVKARLAYLVCRQEGPSPIDLLFVESLGPAKPLAWEQVMIVGFGLPCKGFAEQTNTGSAVLVPVRSPSAAGGALRP
jgi:hypothetical protein